MILLIRKIRLEAVLLMSTMFCAVLTGCDPIDVSTPVHGPGDVYFFGAQRSGVGDTTLESTYWKNGVAVTLSNGARYDQIVDLVVSGGDVHAMGYDGGFLMYWKNGIATNLGDSLTSASQLCISNGNVYILARSSRNVGGPVVIKNGVPSYIKLQGLTPAGSAECIALAVSGNDIYVAGSMYTSNGISPMVWKNGVPVISTTVQGWISDLAVSGSDVYACATLLVNGSYVGQAAYWKNGQLITLTDDTRRTGANSIFLSGSDVYIAGWESTSNATMAKYWKNGIETLLPFTAGSCQGGRVFVSDSTVYVSGININSGDGILWKNGEVVPPFSGTNDQIWGGGLWVY